MFTECVASGSGAKQNPAIQWSENAIPLKELGQLIAQGDPYEGAAAGNSFREEAAAERYDEHPGLRPPPQLPANLNIPEQAHEAEYRQDDEAYDVEDQPCTGRRHCSLALVMAITSLALVGTAGTFGYREIFGGSVLPIPPPIICSGLQDAGGDCVILKN
jgi:hypothetical protein